MAVKKKSLNATGNTTPAQQQVFWASVGYSILTCLSVAAVVVINATWAVCIPTFVVMMPPVRAILRRGSAAELYATGDRSYFYGYLATVVTFLVGAVEVARDPAWISDLQTIARLIATALSTTIVGIIFLVALKAQQIPLCSGLSFKQTRVWEADLMQQKHVVVVN